MQVIIKAKGIYITDAIRRYVEKKMNALQRFYNHIVRANVFLEIDGHQQKGNKFKAECRLEIPGNDVFAAKVEKDLYKAIDKIRDYLELELKKHKDKRNLKDKEKIRTVEKEYSFDETPIA